MKKLLGVILLGVIISGGITGCARAEFQVGLFNVTPTEVVAGESVTVEASISNMGGVDGVYTANLTIDGKPVDSKEITVAARQTKRVLFTLSMDTSGTYSVALDDATATLDVWPHAGEIVELAQESWKDVRTYQAEASITMNMSAKSEDEVAEMNISMNYDMIVDYEAEKMKADITMTLESTEEGKEEGTIEMYLIGDTAYVKVEAPGEPTGWQKETVDPNTWENMQLPQQQLDILETASVELLGTERVDGVDCYILEVSLTGEQMWQTMLQSMAAAAGEEIGPEDMEAMQEVGQLLGGEDMSVRQWVTRDAYFLKKAKMTTDWSLFGLLSIEMGLDMTASNYNEPISIEVPAEAK